VCQKIAAEANPGALILPQALGANISGVITTAIIAAIYVSVLR
jgi:oxaloacetate decarboxylase beta subunit